MNHFICVQKRFVYLWQRTDKAMALKKKSQANILSVASSRQTTSSYEPKGRRHHKKHQLRKN